MLLAIDDINGGDLGNQRWQPRIQIATDCLVVESNCSYSIDKGILKIEYIWHTHTLLMIRHT